MCRYNSKNDSRFLDPCLEEYLIFVQNLGLITRGSCCGHIKYPKTIIIERTNIKGDVFYFDLISGIEIPRKRKFYKKDKQGYYYIPEVSKEK